MRIEDVFGDLPTLETDRLMLRKISMDDAADMFEYASDPEIARYVTWDAQKSIEDSKAFISWVLEQYANGQVAPWGVVLKENGKLIGTCDFVYWNTNHARAEVGYAMSRQYWGQGLTPEAVRAILAFGFDKMRLNRIEARCNVPNTASARVMEKVGMQFEGILRQQMFTKGNYDDLKMYSILRSEWDS